MFRGSMMIMVLVLLVLRDTTVELIFFRVASFWMIATAAAAVEAALEPVDPSCLPWPDPCI